MVVTTGFEPARRKPAELESAPLDQLGHVTIIDNKKNSHIHW